ncbi:hypothetical protein K7432_012157, partial [Basidiobolus ranarum]
MDIAADKHLYYWFFAFEICRKCDPGTVLCYSLELAVNAWLSHSEIRTELVPRKKQ